MTEDQMNRTWLEKSGGYARTMTLRDCLAMEAMNALVGCVYWRKSLGVQGTVRPTEFTAYSAYEMADAMLKERAKHQPNRETLIDEWNLTTRTTNCLKAENIFTVADLLKFSLRRLRCTPNMGAKSIKEIVDVAAKYGFVLKE
jgi:DNA-directed RNA polymerase alpha subunit